MHFRSYDNLRVFNSVATNLSFTRTAASLCKTKGAISYQIKRLEEELGFTLFVRAKGGISLTPKGKQLWMVSHQLFTQLDAEIAALRQDRRQITIAMSTYFGSRWLLPRLMTFTSQYPEVGLRIQPMLDLIDTPSEEIDMSIRWGDGEWSDMSVELLFNCPAIAMAGRKLAESIVQNGLEQSLENITLLHDREDSLSWLRWHEKAGLTYHSEQNNLVIPDPNVRVQAVINNQGLGLYDSLVANELETKELIQVSPVKLDNYGYFLTFTQQAMENPALGLFHQWIRKESMRVSISDP